jgi:hypothetical protein
MEKGRRAMNKINRDILNVNKNNVNLERTLNTLIKQKLVIWFICFKSFSISYASLTN